MSFEFAEADYRNIKSNEKTQLIRRTISYLPIAKISEYDFSKLRVR